MNIIDFLQEPVFQRAFLAAIIAGGTISLLGVVIIAFNLTTIRFALMHFGLLGGAIGLAVGANPLTAALAAITACSLLFGPVSDKIKLDTGLIGALFTTSSISLAFLLFYKTGIPAIQVFSLFTGSILTLTNNDLFFIIILGSIILFTFIVFFKEIQLIFFDAEQAEWLGIPVKRIRNGLLFLTGLSVGTAMKITGALLMDALILLCAMAAMRLAKNFKQLLILTSVFGILSAAGGLLLSMVFDFPTGVTITLSGVFILLICTIIPNQHF